MKEQFIDCKIKGYTQHLIDEANQILEDPEFTGYTLTLRQLYYQFVAKSLLPNNQKEYSRLGVAINTGRLAGLIDWARLDDLTRSFEHNSHWVKPAQIIQSASVEYCLDKWEGQKYRVEVWVEKEALANVVSMACDPMDVPWFCCRGYASQSSMYLAGKRLIGYMKQKQLPVILYLGDHDPSGLDMERDIAARLKLFTTEDIIIKRVALTWDQIEQYQLPPNPVKLTDSRTRGYIDEYGVDDSWELDALKPSMITGLLVNNIRGLIQSGKYRARVHQETEEKKGLEYLANNYNQIMRQAGL